MDHQAFLAGLSTTALLLLVSLLVYAAFADLRSRTGSSGPSLRTFSLVERLPEGALGEAGRRFIPIERELRRQGYRLWGDFHLSGWPSPRFARFLSRPDGRVLAWISESASGAAVYYASLLSDGVYLETSRYDLPDDAESASSETVAQHHDARLKRHRKLFGADARSLERSDVETVVECGQRALLAAYIRAVGGAVPPARFAESR